ncbi:Hypothetical protein BN2458_PEG0019 [Helicobacter typhlonius]|uniref:Uncharacterized protein n=1 Tax=Helicobacter typhlonius TaxID=76936 RepID=A0A0S4PSI4_9HELI|nr:Hypothetical protein BN2458_PEG0019 [Helicobacter typhlonius]
MKVELCYFCLYFLHYSFLCIFVNFLPIFLLLKVPISFLIFLI